MGRRRSPHVIGPEEAGPLGHPGVRTAGRYIPWVEQEPEAPLGVRDLLRVGRYEPRWPVPERQRVAFERLQALERPLPRLQVRADARVKATPQRVAEQCDPRARAFDEIADRPGGVPGRRDDLDRARAEAQQTVPRQLVGDRGRPRRAAIEIGAGGERVATANRLAPRPRGPRGRRSRLRSGRRRPRRGRRGRGWRGCRPPRSARTRRRRRRRAAAPRRSRSRSGRPGPRRSRAGRRAHRCLRRGPGHRPAGGRPPARGVRASVSSRPVIGGDREVSSSPATLGGRGGGLCERDHQLARDAVVSMSSCASTISSIV